MFSRIILPGGLNAALVHVTFSAINGVQKIQDQYLAPLNTVALYMKILIPLLPLAPPVTCNDDFMTKILLAINTIISILTGLGVGVAVIGIAIGGLMRATSFGNERRIATSNTAITCAVIGLVIVILALTLGRQIPQWLQLNDQTCPVGSDGVAVPGVPRQP